MPVWKQLLVLLLLACLSGVGYAGYRNYFPPELQTGDPDAGPRPVSVEVAPAELRRLARKVEAVGTTRAARSVEIVPVVDGRVVEVNFHPGEPVEAGHVLIRLDDDIERANLVEAEAMLAEQRHAVERTRQLQASNAVARAQVEQVVAELAAREAALERAKRRLADREIRAPFAGIVGLTDLDPGAWVEAGEKITTIDDLSTVEVEFSLPETLFGEIHAGQPVAARSAAFPDRVFEGEVRVIGTRVDEVSRAFRVRALIPNPEGALPAGMFMFLALTLSETEAIVVPEEAIVAQAADTYVYVVKDGRTEQRRIATGQRQEGVIAVPDGLAAGEVVVTRGTQRLRDGAPVKVLNQPATAAVAVRDGT